MHILYRLIYLTQCNWIGAKSMAETAQKAGRGRPRKFDPSEALRTAQTLFHRRGYDGVSLSDLTGAMGITPPSFYAAFHSKAGLFDKALQRYSLEDGIPFAEILRPGRDVAKALGELLEEAAKRYSADAEARGCLVLASRAAIEPEARQAAIALQTGATDIIRAFVVQTHPLSADAVTDYVAIFMAGLSAEARAGATPQALLRAARNAQTALEGMLSLG